MRAEEILRTLVSHEGAFVCVKVDCHCSNPPDWPWYPRHLIGLHRVKANDPRLSVGGNFAKDGEYCHGTYYAQSCENDAFCNTEGEVIEIISQCDGCKYSQTAECPISR